MDKNTVIGFILIGVVLIGFSWLNRPSQKQIEEQRRYRDSIAVVQQQQQIEIQTAARETKRIEASFEELTDSARQAQIVDNYGVFADATTGKDEIITLENDRIEVRISSKGGHVCYARVKNYVTYDKEPLVLFEGDESTFNVAFITADNRIVNTSELYFTPVEGASTNTATMRLSTSDGGLIDFVYTLQPNDYMLHFNVRTTKMNEILSPSTNALDLQWSQKMRTLEKGRKLENQYTGLYYKYFKDDVEHFGEYKDEELQLSNRLKWVGYKNKYFTSALIADGVFTTTHFSARQETTDTRYLKLLNTTTSVAYNPASDEPVAFRFFFGPNKYALLRSYDKGVETDLRLGLDNLVPMGYKWVRPINKYFILPIFDFLNKFMSNYGLIIFLLTLAVKVVLFPLTYKSYLSQAKMRVLRPQVETLKLKFPKKEQAMELQQATMALYSSAGASPMSGCLPQLLQLPILIALYWLFPTSIELRQQGFLWAEDLSTYDAICSWNADIPIITSFMGNHISLFCLLMTVVNIFQTKMSMSMSNTGQQMPGMNTMMYIMPLMFFFMFNQNSAGLSYYFLVSTLITIAQTLLFRFAIDENKLLARLEENKKKPKKKSGFMQRMAEAQRQQQEKIRQQQQQRDKQMRSRKR